MGEQVLVLLLILFILTGKYEKVRRAIRIVSLLWFDLFNLYTGTQDVSPSPSSIRHSLPSVEVVVPRGIL